jgi:cbb3-type cytochrome oxidase maturation protein
VDILYLLIPLSVVLILGIVGVFGWAIHSGQLEDLDREGLRILDVDQDALRAQPQESSTNNH